jgi:dCTP deaminase
MYLSDSDIKKAVVKGEIRIDDFDEARLQPASYDILLGNKFVVNDSHQTGFIDPEKKIYAKTHEIVIPDGGEFILHPGVSVLGTSWDFFGSDKYLVQLGGKSSLARIGLMVHNTAGLINPGHFLNITLELCNLNNVPIILRPKMHIGQLTFSQMTMPPKRSYKEVGRFAGNNWNNFALPKALALQSMKKEISVKVKKSTPKTKALTKLKTKKHAR